MTAAPDIATLETMRKCLRIDRNSPTGLRWMRAPSESGSGNGQPGTIGGSIRTIRGCIEQPRITVRKKVYAARDVVFFLHNGHWPTRRITHIDRNRMNVSPENLQEIPPTARRRSTGHAGYAVAAMA